jgi:hypothetical protein
MRFQLLLLFLVGLQYITITEYAEGHEGSTSSEVTQKDTVAANNTLPIISMSQIKEPAHQRIASLLLKLVRSDTADQFQENYGLIAKTKELQNQAYLIKGGAAAAGDYYYIITSGELNQILDAKTRNRWHGKKSSEYEVIFYDKQRTLVIPNSTDEIRSLWAFIFAQEKVLFINIERNTFGYYIR